MDDRTRRSTTDAPTSDAPATDPSAVDAADLDAEPVVALVDVGFSRGGRAILRRIDFTASVGSLTVIEGGNGSGKSTLLRVLSGELWPDRDGGRRRYVLDGRRVESPLLARPAIRRIAPETQERALRLRPDATAYDAIACGLIDADDPPRRLDAAQDARVRREAAAFGLLDRLASPVGTLSHGLLRRALWARACLSRPALLLLVEAWNGVDAETLAALHAALAARLREGAAVVAVAHDPATLPPSPRRVYRLVDGVLTPATEPSRVVAPPRALRPAAAPPSGAAAPLVALDAAELRIDGRAVLKATWAIRAGEAWLLEGGNGAGKSVLLELLAGDRRAAAGSLRRGGEGARPRQAELRRRVALCSDRWQARHDRDVAVEAVVASGWTGAIGVAGPPAGDRARAVAETLEELGVGRLRGRSMAGLSFGERRLVLLARALAPGPELLLLDEVGDGLDGGARDRLAAAIERRRAAGLAVVVAAHRSAPALAWSGRARLARGRLRLGAA